LVYIVYFFLFSTVAAYMANKVVYKRSVLWPSKYTKTCFRGWLMTRRRPRSRLGREHPSPYSTPLGTDPPSALVMPPRISARSTPMPTRGSGGFKWLNSDVRFSRYITLSWFRSATLILVVNSAEIAEMHSSE